MYMFLSTYINQRYKLLTALSLILLMFIVFNPVIVRAFAGFGDYMSELALGNGTNGDLYLGDGTNELTVLGTIPVISTLAATDVKEDGGGTATLRGTLTSLNGMPRADYYFRWGYSSGSLTNTTASVSTAVTGTFTTVITGFDIQKEVFYQFYSGTDGTALGGVLSFPPVDAGFNLLNTALLALIALIIIIVVFKFSGNPITALVLAIIGIVAFVIAQSVLLSM
jgi:hypothetical protein